MIFSIVSVACLFVRVSLYLLLAVHHPIQNACRINFIVVVSSFIFTSMLCNPHIRLNRFRILLYLYCNFRTGGSYVSVCELLLLPHHILGTLYYIPFYLHYFHSSHSCGSRIVEYLNHFLPLKIRPINLQIFWPNVALPYFHIFLVICFTSFNTYNPVRLGVHPRSFHPLFSLHYSYMFRG